MLAVSLIGITTGTELCTFGRLPIALSEDWIEISPSDVALQSGGRDLYVCSRRLVEGQVLTWVGLYRHAFEIGGNRSGSYYGAGVWLLGKTARGDAIAHVLPLLANQVRALAMSGEQFTSRLADIRSRIAWPEAEVDRVGHSMQPVGGGGLSPGPLATLFLDASDDLDRRQVGWHLDWLQMSALFGRYSRAMIGTDELTCRSARDLRRLEVLKPLQLLATEQDHATTIAEQLARLDESVAAANAAQAAAIARAQELDARLQSAMARADSLQLELTRTSEAHTRTDRDLQSVRTQNAALLSERDSWRNNIHTLTAARDQALKDKRAVENQLSTLSGDLPRREAALKQNEASLKNREDLLNGEQRQLTQREGWVRGEENRLHHRDNQLRDAEQALAERQRQAAASGAQKPPHETSRQQPVEQALESNRGDVVHTVVIYGSISVVLVIFTVCTSLFFVKWRHAARDEPQVAQAQAMEACDDDPSSSSSVSFSYPASSDAAGAAPDKYNLAQWVERQSCPQASEACRMRRTDAIFNSIRFVAGGARAQLPSGCAFVQGSQNASAQSVATLDRGMAGGSVPGGYPTSETKALESTPSPRDMASEAKTVCAKSGTSSKCAALCAEASLAGTLRSTCAGKSAKTFCARDDLTATESKRCHASGATIAAGDRPKGSDLGRQKSEAAKSEEALPEQRPVGHQD